MRVVFRKSWLAIFMFSIAAFSLFAAEPKSKPAAKDERSVWGIGQAVVDAQGHKEEATGVAARQVAITDDGWHNDERSPTERYRNRLFHLDLGNGQRFDLSLPLRQKKDANGEWRTIGAWVGMPRPAYGNWYHSGFFSIDANGKSINTQDPQVEVEVVESGARGIIDFIWDNPLVRVRTRFIAEPGTDVLFMEVRWEGRPELKTLKLGFACYPQGFGVAEPDRLNGLALQRLVTTPIRDVPQVQRVNLNPATDWWFFYQDLTLEKAHAARNFSGPCALALLPDDLVRAPNPAECVHLDVTGYQVTTSVDLPLTDGRARFALFDFADKTVPEAKKLFLAEAPKVRERMAIGSWLPTAIETLNIASERTRIDGLSKRLGRKAEARLTELRQQLDRLAALQQMLATSVEPIRAERDLNAALWPYQTLRWQVEHAGRKDVRVLFLAGPTAYAWKVEESVRERWGTEAVRRGGYVWKYWVGHRLSYFPGTKTELYTYDVVVLADVPQDPFTPEQLEWLADFARLGGGLLMLGGYYAYSPGNWGDTPLAPLLPVTVGTGFDLQPIKTNPQLHVASPFWTAHELKPKASMPSKDLGCVYWRHNLKPKEGAAVWLTAGGEPIGIVGTVGEGRVMAILGTALGDAPPGQTAFWDAPGWPVFLTRTLEYLARGE